MFVVLVLLIVNVDLGSVVVVQGCFWVSVGMLRKTLWLGEKFERMSVREKLIRIDLLSCSLLDQKSGTFQQIPEQSELNKNLATVLSIENANQLQIKQTATDKLLYCFQAFFDSS
jgi:hypothetical protein